MEFDAHASSYEETLDRALALSGRGGRWFAAVKAERLARLAPRDRAWRALDVGCGPGLVLAALDPRVYPRPAGTDVSAAMVEQARRAAPGAEIVLGPDDGPLPFSDGTFDLAFASCALHHVPPHGRARFLEEMARVTRPGGLVVLFEHNPWNPLTRAVVAGCEFDRSAVLLSAGEACRLLKEAGLRPRRPRFYLFFPPYLEFLRPLERFLGWLPLGGQYDAVAEVP